MAQLALAKAGRTNHTAAGLHEEEGGRPFFIAAGLRRPHRVWHVPKRFYDLYENNGTAPTAMPLAMHKTGPKGMPPLAYVFCMTRLLCALLSSWQRLVSGYWATVASLPLRSFSRLCLRARDHTWHHALCLTDGLARMAA